MTTDHLTQEQKAASRFFPEFWDNLFGLSIITRRDDVAGVPGRFGWDGGYGTSAYFDHKEAMVDSARLGFPKRSGCQSRFLDLCLPDNRGLKRP
jgi:CubicO group peptidase (beta-lactamase class C family)